VPAFCADCRGKSPRRGQARPKVIACERCGAEVSVRARGPLPRFCRNGCTVETVQPSAQPRPDRSAVTGLRPWDQVTRPGAKQPQPAAPTAPSSRPPEPLSPIGAGGGIAAATVTRMDTIHPATIVGSSDLDRRVKVRRIRNIAAGAVWLAIIAIIVLVFVVGSRPAPPGF